MLALAVVFASALAPPAHALPSGPTIFCETYPDAPACIGGKPACTYCHQVPPARNSFGDAVAAALLPDAPRPLDAADYAANLPTALRAIETADTDGDGFTNADEITAGTLPGGAESFPTGAECPGSKDNPLYKVCEYDRRFVFKKVNLDFCGRSPTYESIEAFSNGSTEEQDAAIDRALGECLLSEFWSRKDGAVWELAHRKIRPLQALKSGQGGGMIPLADYDDDYNLFVYTHTGDRDVRDVLRGQYFVRRSDASRPGEVTTYDRVEDLNSQNVNRQRRAGLLTTKWNLVYHVMFTALPRTAAAQAYRSYLNLDIARLEGLAPVRGEPADWDAKGVTEPACVVCHSTLDPLSYPFKNYTGLDDTPFGTYDGNRMRRFRGEGPDILGMPEAGSILGQPVQDLVQWAQVAADSPEFARAVVEDFWVMLVGAKPTPEERGEFDALWQGLMTTHGYQVNGMLRDLIRTEAYGVP